MTVRFRASWSPSLTSWHEFVSCKAFWWSVLETQTYTHTHQPHTHTHQPAPFSPAIQTHSHAFTHLLSQPHEELKIDDCTMQGVGGRRGTGEKDEQSSQRKHRAHRGWEEEEMEERKKYDIAKKKQQQQESGAVRLRKKEECDLLSPGCKVEHNLLLLAV